MLLLLAACTKDPPTEQPDTGLPVTTAVYEVAPSSPGGELVCSLNSADEVHRAVAVDGEYRLHGLLADSVYTCQAGFGPPFEHVTEALPERIALTEMIVDGADTDLDYLLFQTVRQIEDVARHNEPKIVITDRDGQVRWYYEMTEGYQVADLTYLGEGRIQYGAGGGIAKEIDLDGVSHWESEIIFHHALQRLDSGMVAGIVDAETFEYVGFGVVVVDPETNNELWRWESPQNEDILPVADKRDDVWHANSLHVIEGDEGLESAYVNLRNQDLLIRITAEGDIDLMMQDDPWVHERKNGQAEEWWEGAHDLQIDGDTILMYDNGKRGATTRVLEFTFDEETQVATTEFQWTENWRESIWGGVDPVGDDRILVARGHCIDCSGGGPGRSELIELDRDSRDVVWRMGFVDDDVGLYRARAVDGCSIFTTDRYCR